MTRYKNLDLHEKLIELGFTEYESKAYCELVKIDKSCATHLAKSANISRGRIYDVLENLCKKGFCKVIPGKKKFYVAISPELAMDNLLYEFQERAKRKEKLFHETAKAMQEMYASTHKDLPLNNVEILSSHTAIQERIKQLQYEAKRVMRVFIKAPIIMVQSRKDSDERMKDQIQKNIKFKQIYEYDEGGYKSFAKSVFDARAKGADFEVRVSMKLPLKLVIFDDDHALFTLDREQRSSRNYSMMSVSHTYLTQAMIELFEFYWNVTMPLEEFVKEYPYE